MRADAAVTPKQLPELLLHVAVVRPVFVWGRFAADPACRSSGVSSAFE